MTEPEAERHSAATALPCEWRGQLSHVPLHVATWLLCFGRGLAMTCLRLA